MPFRELLEEFPLYRKLSKCPWQTLDQVEKPAIHMFCPVCKSEQTFLMVNKYHEGFDYVNVSLAGLSVRAVYMCVSCQNFKRYFFIKFGEKGDYVMKVGQEPSWTVTIDRQVERMLGSHADIYRKGLISESQGYGIGAFAYYRRIVEDILDQLLDEIADFLSGEDKARYAEALSRTKTTRVTQEKIDLVKDLLPTALLPDGLNPLGVLHSALSEGLHAQSDERCVELAATVREVLVFLVNQVVVHKSTAKTFTEGMRKLLNKKSGPTA